LRINRRSDHVAVQKEMLDMAFSGSAHKLVMQALSAKNISAGELAKIRELLDELEGGA